MFTNQSLGGNTQSTSFDPRFKQHGCSFGKRFGGRAFGSGHPWMHKLHQYMGDLKPANIEETASAFIISLYAAGLQKEYFKISVSEDVLTIGYTVPENEGSGHFIYQEYRPASFERSFQLSNKVLTNEVSASYANGVLSVTLRKNPETNKPGEEIVVS